MDVDNDANLARASHQKELEEEEEESDSASNDIPTTNTEASKSQQCHAAPTVIKVIQQGCPDTLKRNLDSSDKIQYEFIEGKLTASDLGEQVDDQQCMIMIAAHELSRLLPKGTCVKILTKDTLTKFRTNQGR